MKHRILAMALALALCLGLVTLPAAAAEGWDGTAATSYAGGSGTRDDPYLISTPGQLALFRDQVNGDNSSICAKVVADIDLNNLPWIPIGLNQTGYTGVFDGGGWAVQNLRIEKLTDTVQFTNHAGNVQHIKAAGLFGIIGVSGVVKYVNVDGIVSGDISSSDSVYIGSVAGASFGTIEECFSTCTFDGLTISHRDYMGLGGIAGNNKGSIKNCYYVGIMHATLRFNGYGNGNEYLGGIAGYNGATEEYGVGEISNCYVAADVVFQGSLGKKYAGTIAGLSYYPDEVINCYYDSQMTTWTSYVIGGFYGGGNHGQNPDSAGDSRQSTENLKSWWMPGALGNAYRYDFGGVNQGYPVLAVMTYGEEAKEDSWYTKELEEYGMTEGELNALVPTALWNKDLTKNVTRAEFAAVAVNLYENLSGEKVTVQIDNPFTDTSNDDIIKAYQLGITNGSSATTFTPYSSISRQDMATMLTRVYKKLYIPGWTLESDGGYKLDYTMPQLFLDDGRIAGYARDSVYYMAAQSILKGSDGYFYPVAATDEDTVGNATREQAIITSIRYYSVNH